MKLLPSEKRMLTILAFVAILALSFQYLLLPEIEKGKELSIRNNSLNLAYGLLMNKNGEASAIEVKYDKENASLNLLLDKEISPALRDEDLDRYFTELGIRHGLRPTSLAIEYPLPETETYKTIQTANITIGVEGSIAGLQSLLEEVDQKTFLKVVYFNTSGSGDSYNHTLKIEIMMLKGN